MSQLNIARFFTYLICDNGYLSPKEIGNGNYACIMPLMFTHAIIKGRIGNLNSYEDRWCYSSLEKAQEALDAWDGVGEPEGWHRHPMTGRRREVTEEGLLEETINP
ncbi:hypothetical protein [Sulfitobacter sp. R18_1]|uniref:hypothetical protein n=1 Tax=Sulfitobacter sp. R18_1 TaxID=2821104 RepID=UPI001ADB5688|nr:hypothetical protein [Sulfitobacter sp. R18_1]MBO9428582.1 hypothetical protein [Sulfitobacter sp. R18_1]